MKNQLFILTFVLSISSVFSQAPINDNCNGAVELMISKSGYAFDTVIGTKTDISNATREVGELCSNTIEDVGNCDKTIWYKFYLPTTRNVGVKLTQTDSAIPQIFSGFSIYKIKGCGYLISDLSEQLQPIAKFGVSGNSCLSQGYYLIQVSAKNKAKGELWVELDVSKPQSETYDDFQTCFDVSAINWNQTYNKELDVTCASVDSSESKIINDSIISKSVWFSYTLEENALEQSVKILGGFKGGALKYRIFFDTVTIDSVLSNKPFTTIVSQATILKVFCNNQANRKMIVQVICANVYLKVKLEFKRIKSSIDQWNTPQTDQLLTLYLGAGNEYTTNSITCEGDLSTHACSSVIGSELVHRSLDKDNAGNDLYDTFKYGGYVVLDIRDDGVLSIKNSLFNWTDYNYVVLMTLYQGDVRNTCNLVKLSDSIIRYAGNFKVCVKPGKYTLLVGVQELRTEYRFAFQFSLKYQIPNVKFQYPQTPELIPDYNPIAGIAYVTESVDFSNKDTVLNVENLTLRGRMNFREFYLSNSGELNASISGTGYLYLFEGSIKNGAISLIDEVDYSRNSSYIRLKTVNGATANTCLYLEKGNYTLVGLFDETTVEILNLTDCEYVSSKVTLSPINLCPSNNNVEPQFAKQINNNQSVFNSNYLYRLYEYKYTLGICKDCKSTSSFVPNFSCVNAQLVNDQSVFYYYTFKMESSGSAYFIGNYEIYKGDAAINPNILLDTSNILSPCNGGGLICNLEGGQVYTLVFINPGAIFDIKFAKHYKSVNDFASSAIDLGDASLGKTSAGEYISCHTGSYDSDPSLNLINSLYIDSLPIRYLDSLNYKRKSTYRGNIWYTFTVNGNSKFRVDVQFDNNLSGIITHLYRYKNTYESDFNRMVLNGFDSTNQGMELVWVSNYNGGNFSFEGYNKLCKDSRYFVVIEQATRNSIEVKKALVWVSATASSSTVAADQCSTAQTLNVSNPGSFLLSADNTCHSYGGSPFEEVFDANKKTTWLKISVNSLSKFDLSIRNSKGNGVLSYVVYGGYCGALTRIGKTNDRFSYFTLSCMGAGDYYIQVFSNSTISETIEFEVEVSDGKNLVCKSYDFIKPLAQFKIQGGCNDEDSVYLVNYSTRGDDIEYTWIVNNQFFSNETEPKFNRKQSDLKDSNSILLIVKNKAINSIDSFELNYRRDTQSYQFAISGVLNNRCDDEVNLNVLTNFPYKINYTWFNPNELEIGFGSNFKNYYSFNKIYVKGNSDNCSFINSALLTVISSLGYFKDTQFCEYQSHALLNDYLNTITVYHNGGFANVLSGESYEFKNSGQYIIRYIVGNCSYMDTIDVDIQTGSATVYDTLQMYACNSDSVQISNTNFQLQNYQWVTGNTNDTFQYLTVKSSGTYQLRGRLNRCTHVESVVNLLMDELNIDLLTDTAVCYNAYIDLKSPYPDEFDVLEQVPGSIDLYAKNSFKRVMRMKRSLCEFTDSSYVTVYPNFGGRIDTLLCSPTLEFELKLDAKVAKDYNWYLTNANGRYFLAKQYGYYPVKRTDINGCIDTIEFNVVNNCEFMVFVPDVFTPNQDGHNEAFGPFISGQYQSYHMQIFNRWGEMVFITNSSQKWNADYMGEMVQQGVYSYLITVFDKNGKAYYFKGTLTLLK